MMDELEPWASPFRWPDYYRDESARQDLLRIVQRLDDSIAIDALLGQTVYPDEPDAQEA